MFFSVAFCAIAPETKGLFNETKHPKPAHFLAPGGDILLGIALIAIGAVATQYGFLPSHVQYALIGAGVAYSIGTLCALGFIIKMIKAPDAFLC